MARIFVSYSRADRQFIDQFIPLIRRVYGNESVWFDDEIHGGANWWEMILSEIGKCDLFVYLVSSESLESPYCQAELREALRLKKQILPVIVRRLNPTYPGNVDVDLAEILTRTQFVDMSGGFRNEATNARVWGAINHLLTLVPHSTTPQTTTPTPEPPIPEKKKPDTTIRAAYIAGAFALLAAIIAGVLGLWQGVFANRDTNDTPVPTTVIVQNPTHTPLDITPTLSGFQQLLTTEAEQTQAAGTRAAFDLTITEQFISDSNMTATAQQFGVTETIAHTTLIALSATATSSPTNTPVPPSLTSTPTETVIASLTPSNTATELPTATSTPPPTFTATPTPTVTFTPSATRTPSPAEMISPSNAIRVTQIRTLYDQAQINDLVFTPDGSFLITVDLDNNIKVWDIATGNVIRSWRQIGVWVIAISPDGNLIAGGATDNKIYIWELQTGNLVTTLQGHSAAVSSIDFNPTCPTLLSNCDVGLVSGGFDNRVRLWNLESGTSKVLSGHVSPVSAVAFNPNGLSVVSGSSNGAMIEWNVRTQRQISTLRGHSGTILTIAFSKTCVDIAGSCTLLMASSGDDRRIILWNPSTGQQIDELRHTHTAAINTLSFSPDGRLLVTGSSDFTVRILDIENDRELTVLNEHRNFVSSVKFSPNGQLIASGSTDETVKLWGLDN